MKKSLNWLCCILALALIVQPASAKKTAELRGLWISDTTQLDWDQTIRDVKRAGFNTLFVNFASAGVAFYPSEYLPYKAPREPLTYLVEAAHREGIAVHAKLLTFFMYWAPPEECEQMIKESRVLLDTQGKVHRQAQVPWLDPSQEENRKRMRNVIHEILQDFDVDGIQLDYIRFFEEKDVPESIMNIRRTTITNFTYDMGQLVRESKPNCRYSASVFYDLNRARGEMAQEWDTWIKRGIFTFLVPMNYTTHPSELHKWMARQSQTADGQVALYSGLGSYMKGMTPKLLFKEITMVRQAGWPGFVLFSYNPEFAKDMLPKLSLFLNDS